MKMAGQNPMSLPEMVERLLVVYADRKTTSAAAPSAATVTLATQQFLHAFSGRKSAGSFTGVEVLVVPEYE